MSMEPAKSIIEKCGGPAKVAEITGRDLSRVYRWMYPADRGGSNGRIPYDEADKLLKYAAKNGITLEPGEFFATPSGGAA